MTAQTGELEQPQTPTAQAAPPDGNTWTDIGKAEIVYTLFGRAKVRVIHKGDKERQTKRMLVAVVVFAIAGYWLLTNMDYFREPEILEINTAPAVVIPSESMAAVSAPVSAAVTVQAAPVVSKSVARVYRPAKPELISASSVAVISNPAAPRVYRAPVVASGVAPATTKLTTPATARKPVVIPQANGTPVTTLNAGGNAYPAESNSFTAPINAPGN